MCIGIPPEVIQLLLVRFELPSKASDQPLPRFLLRLPRSQPLDDVLATLPEEPEYRARTCFLNDWPLTSVERRDLEARVTLGLLLSPTPSRRTPGTFPGAIRILPPELPVEAPDLEVQSPDASFRLQATCWRCRLFL